MEEKTKNTSNQKEIIDMWKKVLENCGIDDKKAIQSGEQQEKDIIKKTQDQIKIEQKNENLLLEVKVNFHDNSKEKKESKLKDKFPKRPKSVRSRNKNENQQELKLTPEQIEKKKQKEEARKKYREAHSIDNPVILPEIEGRIFYFRHIRDIKSEIPQVIDVYGYLESTREIVKIWNGMIVDVKNNCSLEDFVSFKEYLPHGTFVYTEKIKSNQKIKRPLVYEDGNYIAKCSDNYQFEFDDSLLSDEEKKYYLDSDS